MADSKSKAKDERTADEIRRDIAAIRARLAAGVENLVEEVHPASLKREASDRARDFVQGEFDQVKGQIKDEHGWRVQRIAAAGGALAAGVISIVLRAIVGRATGATARRKLEKLQLSEAKRVRKGAKQRRKDDAKAAKKNAKLGKKNAKKYGKLNIDDSSVSNLAEKMLKQAAVLRAQAAAEREHGVV